MATKPFTSEAIARTEEKINMTLDEIIHMSKADTTKPKNHRVSNRGWKYVSNAGQNKIPKSRRFVDTRSSLIQGALSRRRSNFHGNQFPLAAEAAKGANFAPVHNRTFNQSKLFKVNRPRVGRSNVQKFAAYRISFVVKRPLQRANAVPKKRPQTLDSLFATMKEQRMRVLSKQNNGVQRNRRDQPTAPWIRNHLRY